MNISILLRCLALTMFFPTLAATAQLQPVPAGSLPRLKPTSDLPPDQAALFERVRAAYYHPGKTGLACEGKLDYSGVFAKMGAAATNQDGMKSLDSMRLHVTSGPEEQTKVDFSWPSTIADAQKLQIEAGARQMLGGFFQAYWPIANAAFVPQAKDKSVMHRDDDGDYIVEGSSGAEHIVMTVGKDDLLQKVITSSALGAEAVMDLHYTAPVEPKPGDRLRFSGIDVDERTGSANRIQANMTWDYQTVGGVNIPRRVIVRIPGAFELPVEFSECSVHATVQVKVSP